MLLVTALMFVMASVGLFWRFAMPTIQLEPANSPGAMPAFIPAAVSIGVPQRPVNTAGHVVSGNAPGLYGGSKANACDVEAMRDFLATHPAQASAWAQSLMINAGQIPTLLSSLTPLTLRTDTAVTNHGFDNGVAMPFQSVLQAGTAVLVDGVGLPRVRCYCGNPLQVPSTPVVARYQGVRWAGFDSETVTTINAAPQAVDDFVVVKPETNEVVTRRRATRGGSDRAADESIVRTVQSGLIGQTTGTGSSAPGSSGSSESPAAPVSSSQQPAIAGTRSASEFGTATTPPASDGPVPPSNALSETLASTGPTTSTASTGSPQSAESVQPEASAGLVASAEPPPKPPPPPTKPPPPRSKSAAPVKPDVPPASGRARQGKTGATTTTEKPAASNGPKGKSSQQKSRPDSDTRDPGANSGNDQGESASGGGKSGGDDSGGDKSGGGSGDESSGDSSGDESNGG